MAFDPIYATTGQFWVTYTTLTDEVLARYSVSDNPTRADPASAQIILQIPHPTTEHFGGQLQFGPDGYLYLSVGDGGYAPDTPSLNGQRLTVLLGKLLRLDVSGDTYKIPPDNPFIGQPEIRPEIWAYGFRNPWRFSFDRATNDIYIADVGEKDIEEINLQPAGSAGGENYGWNIFEGRLRYSEGPETGLTWPIFEVNHEVGFCAIIGGYVYRGTALPELAGAYLFSDYCTGQVWALSQNGSGDWMPRKLLDTPFQVTSFGEDAAGEVYVLGADGDVYQLSPLSP
jgi:glucose/arabinose dehydrogenase